MGHVLMASAIAKWVSAAWIVDRITVHPTLPTACPAEDIARDDVLHLVALVCQDSPEKIAASKMVGPLSVSLYVEIHVKQSACVP